MSSASTSTSTFKSHCLTTLRSHILTWSTIHKTPVHHAIILDPGTHFSNTLLIVVCDGEEEFNAIIQPEAIERTAKWNMVDYEVIGTVKGVVRRDDDEGEIDFEDVEVELEIEDDRKRMSVFFDGLGGLREEAKFMNRPRNRVVEERRGRKKEKKEKEKEKMEREKMKATAEQNVKPNPRTETEEEAAKRKREKRKIKDRKQKEKRKEKAEEEADVKDVTDAMAQMQELRLQGADVPENPAFGILDIAEDQEKIAELLERGFSFYPLPERGYEGK